jgi:hypothetical protein
MFEQRKNFENSKIGIFDVVPTEDELVDRKT